MLFNIPLQTNELCSIGKDGVLLMNYVFILENKIQIKEKLRVNFNQKSTTTEMQNVFSKFSWNPFDRNLLLAIGNLELVVIIR